MKLINSLKSANDLIDKTVNYIPRALSLDTYKTAMDAMQFNTTFTNSVILTLMVAILQVFFCTLIGYGFARFTFYGRGFLYVFVIVSMLIPPQTIMIAQFLQFRFFNVFGLVSLFHGGVPLNLIDTVVPFGLLSATGFGLKNGLYIYLMTQFFRGIPKEFEESGYVDGAGTFKIFFNIILPNAIPMLATILLFSISWQWTDTYYSNLFLSKWLTLPMAVGAISTYKNSSMSPVVISAGLDAATILIILPLTVLYIFTQKLFIQGIEKSGIVG